MRKIIGTFAAAIAVLGLTAAADARTKRDPEAKLARILDGRVAGEPQDCIYLPSVRSSQIIHRTAIVYDAGSTIYVNRPRYPDSLDDDDIMVTRLHGSGSSLCSIDVVQLKDRSSFFYSGFVGLGKFVPYRKVSARN